MVKVIPVHRKSRVLAQSSLKEMESLPAFNPLDEPELQIPVILNFMLDEPEAGEVNQALDRVIKMANQNLSRSQALVQLTRFYLRAGPGQRLVPGNSLQLEWADSQARYPRPPTSESGGVPSQSRARRIRSRG